MIVHDDIVYKGEKIVVPTSLRPEYLKQIHQGHPSTEAMKNRVRDVFYWPSLSKDVDVLQSQLEFKEFSKEWGFIHKTSSPGFPQSNGLVERAVQTAKKMLDKCKCDGTDPYIALLNLRNTPRDQVLGSPAQRLQARRLKSKLPTASPLLVPKVINPLTVNEQLLQKKLQQKKYYDKSARPLTSFQTRDQVRVQTKIGHARLGMIKRPPIPEQPRSYIMVTVNSKDYRRNQRNLLKVAELEEKR